MADDQNPDMMDEEPIRGESDEEIVGVGEDDDDEVDDDDELDVDDEEPEE